MEQYMRLSAEELAQPLSDDLPCGEDLEYDPAFQQMEVMMQATAEQEFGDTLIAGTGPDWKGVSEQVEDLNKRTRDLRVLTNGALSDLHLTGLGAFSRSLDALNTCMETYWDVIYPELDVDDNNDATIRFNTLQVLNDYQLVCIGLEKAPLIEIKGLGSFSLRDIELAEGKINPIGDEEVHDLALITGAFGDTDAETLTALVEGLDRSITQLKRTVELWSKLATDAALLDIDATLGSLNDVHDAIAKYAPEATADLSDDDGGESTGEQGGNAAAVAVSGTINSRSDVVRMLDKICEYYAVNEPSSPIPLLLRRAQRLVPKSFFEILEDIVPDSIDQVKVISGPVEE
jgi:type VI secretion system protein ImpA